MTGGGQPPSDWQTRLAWNEAGLLPVVVQDVATGQVLMLAWANAEALAQTMATGRGTYWSRSRQELWVKGATSGHTQRVRNIMVDCDADTLLYQVEQTGPACHTGARSCFDAGGPLPLATTGGAAAPWFDRFNLSPGRDGLSSDEEQPS